MTTKSKFALAPRAVPVAARVIGDGGVSTTRATVAMAASAAVRQRVMTSSTFSCCPLIHLRLRSMKPCPGVANNEDDFAGASTPHS
jgi:hypothetical protein